MRNKLGQHLRRMMAGVALLALALVPSTIWSQVPQPVPQPVPVPAAPVDTGQPVPVLSMNQLEGLVAPIALYPDPLISQILVASTYPLEVVEAYQWLQQNPGLTGPALTQAAAAQNWDPSVQALVVFPDVLRSLNQDVNWTTSLGNAFLNQQADVMAAIQQMRASAEQNGRLSSTPQQQVVNTVDSGQPVVEILPTNPEVIYVPVYDPVWVWGPPIYYPYAHWYYPPVRSGLFFSVGIGIGGFFGHGWGGWGGWGWHPAWGSRTVIVNNSFIRENHFNVTRVANVGRTSVWAHDSFHRQGVPYPNQALNQRYAANFRQNTFARQNAFAPRAAAPVQTPARSFAQNNRSGQMAMANPAPRQNFQNFSAPRQNFQNFNAPRQNFSQPRQEFSQPRQNFSQVPQARFENRQVAPQIQNRGNFNAFQGGNSARMQANRSFSSPSQGRSFSAPARESHGQSRGGNGGGGGGGRSHGR